jgi:C4-dicarboxylate transporter DctM subunit
MDPAVLLALGAIAFLLLIGVEIVVCLGIGAIMLTYTQNVFGIDNIGAAAFSEINLFPLLAMPLYILTGDLIAESGIARRLIDFSRALIGWLRGGLALTLLVTSGFFAAISGSNSATVAAMGRMMVPEMTKDRYPRDFSAATAACGGTVGIIIPPSIVFVIYGVASGTSIGDLFLGGIIPGVLMIASMGLIAFLACRRKDYGSTFDFSWRGLLRALVRANLAFGATVIILGGIYLGIATPTEAAAIAAAYCLVAGLLVTRELKLRQLPSIVSRSADVTGVIAPIIAMAIALSQILTVLGLPQDGVEAILALSENPTVIVLCILAILLVAGAIMETTPNVLLLTPLLLPVARELGLDPVHFGVMVVVTLAIGFVTPPLGLNLYVASSVTGAPVMAIARQSIWMVVALMAVALLIAFVPELSTALVPER